MIITIHHLVLSCSVCLGGKFVGGFFVITHVAGLVAGDSLVAATSSRRVMSLGGALAEDRVGCFGPRKLLSPFLSCLIVMKDCLESSTVLRLVRLSTR